MESKIHEEGEGHCYMVVVNKGCERAAIAELVQRCGESLLPWNGPTAPYLSTTAATATTAEAESSGVTAAEAADAPPAVKFQKRLEDETVHAKAGPFQHHLPPTLKPEDLHPSIAYLGNFAEKEKLLRGCTFLGICTKTPLPHANTFHTIEAITAVRPL